MNITVLTMSCCNPALRPQDDLYMAKIREALAKSRVEATVELLRGTEVIGRLQEPQFSPIVPLLRRYGSAAAPALLIDGDLELFGGVPTLEKLIDVISKRASNG